MTRQLLCSIALLLMLLGGVSAPGFTRDTQEYLPDPADWEDATEGASLYWLEATAGLSLCAGVRPSWCPVRYQLEPVSMNTAVLMDCHCPFGIETWYISFFPDRDPDLEGEQPNLWDWYDVQNAAGRLITYD